jgi:hypothetical protein
MGAARPFCRAISSSAYACASMPERNINTVQVSTSRGIVAMPWASREALLAEFSHLDSMRQVREKFDVVGTTRPVELTTAEKGNVVACIDFWSSQIAGGYERMPDGLFELRNALHDDLHDAQRRGG